VSAERRVVVIGAGLAGLAAGVAHARSGANVVVLEAAAQPGGRMAPSPAAFAARVTSADAALLRWIRIAGVGDSLLPLRPVPSAIAEHGRLVPLPPGHDPATARAARVFALQALRTRRLERLLVRYRRHLDPAAPERAAPLDDRSLADFATLYFGHDVVSRWLEPWLAERAPADERELSRAAFLLAWHAERDAVSGALAGPIERLVAALAQSVEVRLATPARAIEPAPRGLRVLTDAARLDADAVVVATPAPAALAIAAPVLTAAERTVLEGVRHAAAIVWRAPARDGAAPLRVRIAPRGASPLASLAIEDGAVVAIAREPWVDTRHDVSDEVVAKEIEHAVERVAPGLVAGPGAIARHALAWPRFDVGRLRAIARMRAVEADRVAAGRPLHWAGDWLAAPTLDGAIRSANAASLR
jgi:predicted NAD/FAD-dependent oxidoreductase